MLLLSKSQPLLILLLVGQACRACGCARKPTRREFAFDDIGSRQTGDAEERRQIFGIAQCRADVGNAPVDLVTLMRYAMKSMFTAIPFN